MRALKIISLALIAMAGASAMIDNTAASNDHDRFNRRIEARLTGYEENPTISVPGIGSFKAVITKDDEIIYELKYSGLESNITQSHIHFGKPWFNGGIAAWLCRTEAAPGPATNPPPDCEPGTEGTVTGVITAANVIGPSGQGISAGEFDELIAAIRSGSAYANVHTVNRGGGEIRGIIR
ncbi:MAG TPA: CHRD domain-containing protein [Vicinamibacterales bacterium]|jgi:hypothetical protein